MLSAWVLGDSKIWAPRGLLLVWKMRSIRNHNTSKTNAYWGESTCVLTQQHFVHTLSVINHLHSLSELWCVSEQIITPSTLLNLSDVLLVNLSSTISTILPTVFQMLYCCHLQLSTNTCWPCTPAKHFVIVTEVHDAAPTLRRWLMDVKRESSTMWTCYTRRFFLDTVGDFPPMCCFFLGRGGETSCSYHLR